MTLTWQATEQLHTFVRLDDLGIMFSIERVPGSKLYMAMAIEGHADNPPTKFVGLSTFQALLGDKFRSVASAQRACAKYLRQVKREHARHTCGGIEVIEATDAERVFIQTWASTGLAARA